MANHGKDIKHAKKLVKKMKVKLLSYKAEKAKLKQKVSELNLKLVTKESTITNLEKSCDTLTDKCNKGMMQLIEAKEENKNLRKKFEIRVRRIFDIFHENVIDGQIWNIELRHISWKRSQA